MAPERPRLVTRSFVLLVIAHFLQALGYASMLLLPLYLDHLGASRAEIGAIMAAGAASGLVFRPAVGWGLDTLGRKPTLVIGTLLLVAAMGLLWFVHDLGALVYLDRILFGIGEGTLFTGYFALAADLIPESRRTEGIALFGVSGLVPLVVNPFAGELGIAPPQLRVFFPVLGGFVLLSLVALRFVQEPKRHRPKQKTSLREALRALGQRALLPAWLATMVFAGLVSTFFAFATVAADARGIDRPAGLWLTYAAGACAVRLLGARVPDRLGPANMVAPALAAYVGAFLLAAGAESSPAFLLAGLAAGIGHGYCFPVLTGQIVTRAPDALRGSALALFTGLWSLADLVAKPLLGAVADRYDDATMFALAAVLAVVGLGAWCALEHYCGGTISRHAPPDRTMT